MNDKDYNKKVWISLAATCITPFILAPFAPTNSKIAIVVVVIFVLGILVTLYYSKKVQEQSKKQMDKLYDMSVARPVDTNEQYQKVENSNYSMPTGKDRENEYSIINELRKNNPSFSKSEFKQNAMSLLQELIHAYNNKNLDKLKEIETTELYNTHQSEIIGNKENIFKDIKIFKVQDSAMTNYRENQETELIEMKITIEAPTSQLQTSQNIMKYISYHIELSRNLNNVENKPIQSKNCPHCNAPLSVEKEYCEFCGNKVSILSQEWQINKVTYWDRGEN